MVFVDAFPMTVTGKVQKYKMREAAIAGARAGGGASLPSPAPPRLPWSGGDRAVNALLSAACARRPRGASSRVPAGATPRADERVLDGFLSLSTPSTWAAASFVSHFFNERPYAVPR